MSGGGELNAGNLGLADGPLHGYPTVWFQQCGPGLYRESFTPHTAHERPGSARSTREPVPVHVVLHEAAERVRGAADAVGIPLSVAPVATDLVVAGDRSQLVSAVTNLLDNAVKYSEPGQPVEVDATLADGSICISVRDQGIGIPSRDLERIFERFYRVDRARDRRTGGSGLGLAIVRHVAANHGGEVAVTSIEGEGSTFTLRLPGVA